MKKTMLVIGLALMLQGYATVAQTTNLPPSSILEDWANGLGALKNWSISPYATYAEGSKTKYGGGILAIYNVNDYIGAGLGADWLGQFSMISGDVSLKKDLYPFKFLGWTNTAVTPFGIAGLSTPYSGAGKANGNLASIAGVGAAVSLGHFWGGRFQTGYEYSVWTGAGEFSGKRHHIFFGYRKGF